MTELGKCPGCEEILHPEDIEEKRVTGLEKDYIVYNCKKCKIIISISTIGW